MLPLLAISLLGPVATLVYAKMREGNTGSPTVDTGELFRVRWGAADDFCLMLAKAVFNIDGRLSSEEKEYLDKHSIQASAATLAKIDEVCGSADMFVAIRNWYNGLDGAAKATAADRVQELVKVDLEQTEEEEAFLIQFAQIIEGNDPLRMFVSLPTGVPERVVSHNIFQHITKERFISNYPASSGSFASGMIYVEHPFVAGALIPFSVEDFDHAQDQMYDGLIAVLKDLGAKRVVISEAREDKRSNAAKGSGGVEASVPFVGASINAGANFRMDELIRRTEDFEVRFDGSKPPLLDRLVEGPWKNRLLKKYAGNSQYQTIISGRFGHNKIKHFSHQVKSTEARKIVKGINAAGKFNKKLVKVRADMKYESDQSCAQTVEKSLKIDFH